MEQETILQEFKEAEAILTGHFILSSGLHSDKYLQCARVMMDARRGGRLCHALAEKVRNALGSATIDLIVSPAMGGVIVGYEMGRHLHVPAVFCERVEGRFTLRRGFAISEGAHILLVEDVITTGKSSLETVECIQDHGGKVLAEACLVDRSGGTASTLGFPVVSLLTLDVATYTGETLPDELKAIPAVKPGSRWV